MALVISRLDYANRLLNKLQLALNNAARLVRKSKKYDHITPVLKDIHWLPVKSRIIFKVLSIVHSAMHSDACPSYKQELVGRYAPLCGLPLMVCFLLYHLVTGTLQLVTMLSAFVTLREIQSQTNLK